MSEGRELKNTVKVENPFFGVMHLIDRTHGEDMLTKLKVLFCLACTLVFVPPIRAQDPTQIGDEKVLIEEIKMNVSALTSSGHFVTDLANQDLVIMEDGRLQLANTVRRVPANVLIMLDTGGTMRGNLSATISAAKTLIGSLVEGDLIAVYQLGDKSQMIADWSPNKAAAAESVQKNLAFGRRTALYRALGDAAGYFPKDRNENRHLVLITAGLDSFNDESIKQAAMSKLLSTDINVHVISYTQMQKGPVTRQKQIFNEGEWKPKRFPAEIVETLPDPKRPGVPDKEREITQREIAKMPRLGGVSLDIERLTKARKRSKELESAEVFLEAMSVDTNGLFLLPGTVDEMNENAAALAGVIDSQWVVAYSPKLSLAGSVPGEVRNIEISSKRLGVQIQAHRKLIVKNAR